MWTLLEFIFDRPQSQKPTRTNTLVRIPRYPKTEVAVLYGVKEMRVIEVSAEDEVVIIASLL